MQYRIAKIIPLLWWCNESWTSNKLHQLIKYLPADMPCKTPAQLQGAMWGFKTRLENLQDIMLVQKRLQLSINNFLQDFWNKRQLGDGPKISQHSVIEARFLKQGLHYCMFKTYGDNTRRQAAVNYIRGDCIRKREYKTSISLGLKLKELFKTYRNIVISLPKIWWEEVLFGKIQRC